MTERSDDHDRLEREREFLLQSLDDLERERDKGAIDDASYERLHDDYTARAAAVIRSLEAGSEEAAAPPRGPGLRRTLTVAGIVTFGVLCAVALAAALGARLPGQTSSGKNVAGSSSSSSGKASKGRATVDARIKRLEAAVAANPDDTASRLLLSRFLEARGDCPGAQTQYDAVVSREPGNAEALAQSGRLVYLTARAATKTDPASVDGLVARSRDRLDAAVAADPENTNARFFRAIVLANEYGAFQTAKSALQRYLVLAPQGQFADQARQLLAEVTNAIDGTPLPTPTTTTPPTARPKRR